MLAVTRLVFAPAPLISYTPLASLLEFVPLPPRFLLAIAGIILLYLACAELAKRWFYSKYSIQPALTFGNRNN